MARKANPKSRFAADIATEYLPIPEPMPKAAKKTYQLTSTLIGPPLFWPGREVFVRAEGLRAISPTMPDLPLLTPATVHTPCDTYDRVGVTFARPLTLSVRAGAHHDTSVDPPLLVVDYAPVTYVVGWFTHEELSYDNTSL